MTTVSTPLPPGLAGAPPSSAMTVREAVLSSAPLVSQLLTLCERPTPKPWGDDLDRALVVELVLATICHRINEDYLTRALARVLRETPNELSTEFLKHIDGDAVRRWLAGDRYSAEELHAEERAQLLRETFSALGDTRIAAVRHAITDGSPIELDALIESLGKLSAFADPMRKKTALFLHRLYLGDYASNPAVARQVPFAVDYHITRLSLRLGWVSIDREMEEKSMHRLLMTREQDVILRSAVAHGLELLSDTLCVARPLLNYSLWQFGRNFCARFDPACRSRQLALFGPQTWFQVEHGLCVLGARCAAFQANRVAQVLDPPHLGNAY